MASAKLKTRKLEFAQFGEKTQQAFDILWLAFEFGFPKRGKEWEQAKLLRNLGEKLEGISEPAPVPGNANARQLTEEAVILFDGFEREQLVAMVKDGEVGWTYGATALRVTLVEALENAPEVELVEG